MALRTGMVLLGVLLFIVGAHAETEEKQPDSSWNFRPSLPSLSSLPSVPTIRSFRQPPQPSEKNAFEHLPGLGGTASRSTAVPPMSSLGNDFLGGSLVYAPSNAAVPALYIEGRGYVPVSDPSIEPYFRPEDYEQLKNNPYVALLPLSAVGGMSTSSPVVMIDPSGQTFSLGFTPNRAEPITISANVGWSRSNGEHSVFFLDGDCCLRQGRQSVQGPHAVIWIEKQPNDKGVREVVVYMESDVDEPPLCLEFDPNEIDAKMFDRKWTGRFSTADRIDTLIVRPLPPAANDPSIFERAQRSATRKSSAIRQTQFLQETPTPKKQPVAESTLPFRRMRFNSRSDLPLDFRFDKFPDNPERGIAVINKGINLIIEGVSSQSMLLGDVVDISADHAVIWGANPSRMQNDGNGDENGSNDFEIYLEGNIIFRDGERRIEAHRMYYETKTGLAYVLDSKLTSPMVGMQGVKGEIRLQAESLQKIGDGLYTAKNGFVSTSQLGEPTYSLHSRTMKLDQTQQRQFLVAENNYVAVGKLPVLYWPWMAADLKDPTFYLRSISFGSDTRDGQSIRTNWNPFQLLNIRNRPGWLDADLALDWIEKRGFGHGFDVDYTPPSCFGIPTDVNGHLRFWGIEDSGTDNLGGRRRNVKFPYDYRYRVFWNHTQELPSLGRFSTSPWLLNAKVGKTSDHNFTNSYFQNEWISDENRTTSLELKKLCGNSSVSIFTEYALDDCYTNTNWLPRLDHTWLGESLLGDRLTWYEHTRVGYANYHTATAPYDAANDGLYTRYLPWELQTNTLSNLPYQTPSRRVYTSGNPDAYTIDTSGEVFSTRHELDLPFNVGPLRCVPYVLGDFSHWGKTRAGDSADRWYGQAGVRLNLPFWKVFPNRSSRTWYVNGLAHKFDLDAELSYARADRSMDDLILYDSLDNWSIDDARRRYWYGTYRNLGFSTDAACPAWFDPRYYALRSGMAGNVTASSMEIADNMTLCRFGMTHRFQTKRGPVGKRRIIDWITASAHFNLYPEHYSPDPENYPGESIGLIDYDAVWNVGDRFALFTSGIYDVFQYGQNVTRVGVSWQRPERGSLTLGVDQLYGLFKQTVLLLKTKYKFNEKYEMNYSTSYDMANNWKNLGHQFTFVRTGESFRFMVGAVYQEATDEWGFTFGIEPVFLRGIAKKLSRANDTFGSSR